MSKKPFEPDCCGFWSYQPDEWDRSTLEIGIIKEIMSRTNVPTCWNSNYIATSNHVNGGLCFRKKAKSKSFRSGQSIIISLKSSIICVSHREYVSYGMEYHDFSQLISDPSCCLKQAGKVVNYMLRPVFHWKNLPCRLKRSRWHISWD